MAIEQPKFKIIEKDGKIELREYDSYVVATVKVNAKSHGSAGSQGFSSLADYIFGNNKSRKQMAMTAPVLTTLEPVSEKIAMAVPVISQKTTGYEYNVSFVMPLSYGMKDLPIPNNSEVNLREVPKHKSLVIRFSGYSNDSKVSEKTKQLESWAQKHNIKLNGKPMLARYDAPWKPGFLRHNEVIIDCL